MQPSYQFSILWLIRETLCLAVACAMFRFASETQEPVLAVIGGTTAIGAAVGGLFGQMIVGAYCTGAAVLVAAVVVSCFR